MEHFVFIFYSNLMKIGSFFFVDQCGINHIPWNPKNEEIEKTHWKKILNSLARRFGDPYRLRCACGPGGPQAHAPKCLELSFRFLVYSETPVMARRTARRTSSLELQWRFLDRSLQRVSHPTGRPGCRPSPDDDLSVAVTSDGLRLDWRVKGTFF